MRRRRAACEYLSEWAVAQRLADQGLEDSKADMLTATLGIVWGGGDSETTRTGRVSPTGRIPE